MAKAQMSRISASKMEVVALNEQLREEFAGVVKHFLTIRRDEISRVAAAGGAGLSAAVEAIQSKQKKLQETQPSDPPATKADDDKSSENAASTQPQVEPDAETKPEGDGKASPATEPVAEVDPVAAKALERKQLYAAQAQLILRRVNMYQYTTRAQFGVDVAVLLELADSNDQKLMLRHLVEQQHALMTPRPRDPSAKRRKVNGLRVDTVGIPGIQQRLKGEWVCNVNSAGYSMTLAERTSRDEALEVYSKLRKQFCQSPTGMKALQKEVDELSKTRSKFDNEVLRDAMKQVKQRLPIPKHYDVAGFAAALTPHPPPQAQAPAPQPAPTPAPTTVVAMNGSGKDREKEKEPKPSRKRDLAVVTTLPPASTKPITPAAASPALVKSRTPTDKESLMGNLYLRRLVQMKLCRHLEGREVCARRNKAGIEDSWQPTGKLEKGKVLSYSTKRPVSFSDFVVASLKKSVAACAHIYLVETQENIDSHLLVCDEFNDSVRSQLPGKFKEISEKYVEGKLKNFK